MVDLFVVLKNDLLVVILSYVTMSRICWLENLLEWIRVIKQNYQPNLEHPLANDEYELISFDSSRLAVEKDRNYR